jgi:ATP-binding cassette, subfamily A (ABC1), member 3
MGSSLFLKTRFGVGYNLVLTKSKQEATKSVESFIECEIEGSDLVQEVSSEIVYRLPAKCSWKFGEFFERLD